MRTVEEIDELQRKADMADELLPVMTCKDGGIDTFIYVTFGTEEWGKIIGESPEFKAQHGYDTDEITHATTETGERCDVAITEGDV